MIINENITKDELKKFKDYFRHNYSHISHSLNDKKIEKFLNQKHIKGKSLEQQADSFSDYLLSQGQADDVMENTKNYLKKLIKEVQEEIIIERLIDEQILNDELEESEASEKAKQMGLKYAGFGRYEDSTGRVVARTIDGKLQKVKKATHKIKNDLKKMGVGDKQIKGIMDTTRKNRTEQIRRAKQIATKIISAKHPHLGWSPKDFEKRKMLMKKILQLYKYDHAKRKFIKRKNDLAYNASSDEFGV